MHQTSCRLSHSVCTMRHLPYILFYPFSFVLDPHGRYVVISPWLGKGSSSLAACRLWPKMKMSVSREVKIANSTARLLLLRLMPTTTLVVCCVWKDSSFFLDRCPWRGIQHFSSDEILLWFVLCTVLLPCSKTCLGYLHACRYFIRSCCSCLLLKKKCMFWQLSSSILSMVPQ